MNLVKKEKTVKMQNTNLPLSAWHKLARGNSWMIYWRQEADKSS